jgi:hypothetical protein
MAEYLTSSIDDKQSDSKKAAEIIKRLDQLKEIRRPYELLWDEEIEFVAYTMRPVRYYQNYQWQQGTRVGTTVYDGTAMSALNLMADGFQGYLVGRALRWLALRLPHPVEFSRTSLMRTFNGKRMDQIPEIRQYLTFKEEVMYSAFQRSNFYDCLGRWIRDCGTIGTSWLMQEEEIGRGTIAFHVLHPRQCFIGENCYDRVDTVFREYRLSLRKMVQKWGEEVLSGEPEMDRQYRTNPYVEYDIVHAIYPRDDIQMYQAGPGKWKPKLDKKNKPYASMWVLKGKKKLLEESGFDTLPIHTWRWDTNTGETYGWGPTTEALVDVITGNQLSKDMMIASQMQAQPMWNVPEEMRGEVSIRPRALNYFKDPARIMSAIENKAKLPWAKEREDMVKAAIRDHYHVDFFMMLSRAAFENIQLTATQVLEMTGEKAVVLGPKIGRWESEGLDQVVDNVDAIETAAGRMPDPPQVLLDVAAGKSIQVDYIGPLAMAQKAMFKRQGITSALETAKPWFEIFPESKLVVKPDKAVRKILEDDEHFPNDAIRTDEEYQAETEKVNQQIAQQQQLAVADRMAQHAPGLTKAPEPGSPMEQVMGQMGASNGG